MIGESATDANVAERLAMLSALVNGDTSLAYRLATDCLANGVPFDRIVDNILQPVQEELGRRWADGELGIADEHASTAAIEELLIRLGTTAQEPTGPTVVITSAERDTHVLGARAVASALALDGFRAVFIGPSMPAIELGDFLDVQQPAALALSCSVPSALAGAAGSASVAHGVGIPVVGGGRAVIGAERAARLGFDAYAASPRDAVGCMRAWAASPPSRLRLSPAPVPEQRALADRGPTLIAIALDGAEAEGARPRAAIFEEITRVLQVVESALLLDEPRLVAEHLQWLRDTGPAHGFARVTIEATLTNLARAMDGDLGRAGDALRVAMAWRWPADGGAFTGPDRRARHEDARVQFGSGS